jgi:ketosteroid isomerase-like protein
VGGDGAPPETAVQIVATAMRVYERGDLEALAAFIHPDAEIEMLLLAGGAAHGPLELRDALAGAERGIHRPRASRFEAFGDDAVVMTGRIQHRDARGAIYDRKAVWLTIVRDGKLWRSRALADAADVPAAYEELTRRPAPAA